MNTYKKIKFLLSDNQKKFFLILNILLFVGVLLEMAGLGILLPILAIMLSSNIQADYPNFYYYILKIGNPSQVQIIIFGLLFLVAFYLFKMCFILYLNWMQAKFSNNLSESLSQNLFKGYLDLPYTFHLQRNSSTLISHINGEVSIFTTVTQSVMNLQTELSIILGVASMLIIIEPFGSIIVLLFMAISAFIFQQITKKRLGIWGLKRQEHEINLNKHLIQGLHGVKDVKVLGREDYFLSKFQFHNAEKVKINIKYQTLLQFPRVYLEFLSVIGMACLIIIMLLQNKPLTHLIPTLGVFVSAAFRMIPSLNRIMASTQSLKFAEPVVDVLYNEFKLIEKQKIYQNSINNILYNSTIKLDNISYKYENTEKFVLQNISININKGDIIGLIGTSGSGKSTLVDIILGLLKPNSGKIQVDEFDIINNMRCWQEKIGYVPQAIYLTDDTIENNIAFGIQADKIDLSKLENAIKLAQLEDLIKSLPDGKYTIVGERGVRLSGGQRQRIGIARALYRNPDILVLDEATSALDNKTETEVMQSIYNLKGDITIIIVAHRLTTVSNCDMIYNLELGEIIKFGKPSELLIAS
jgi:ABC-type bacteriocin/lantibiotic exporter with double-glycine peptidase domain